MTNQTITLNRNMMYGLQNCLAYSDYARQLHQYMRGLRASEQYELKYAFFEYLRTWSKFFDEHDVRFQLEDTDLFWVEIGHRIDGIKSLFEEYGFFYKSENYLPVELPF